MTGRSLLIGGGVFLALFTVVLWYFQTYAFYDDLPQQPLVIQGIEYPVESWEGTDASSSPLKRRVCLTVAPATAQQIAADQPAFDDGEPLVAPSWFECFDAEALARDLATGAARMFMVESGTFDGVDEILALYPDGRGFVWRQLQPRFRNQ